MTANGPHATPKRRFYTQSLREWLKFFLSRPGIEDIIDQSYQHKPNPHVMGCLWDSPAWQDLPGNFSMTPGNLTFNIYIDWFNPFTNKIAGKTVSAGIILATCLNIPYELRETLGATCHLGITPLPQEPSVTTINNLTLPIVTELEDLWEGVTIPTFRHPEGVQKRVGILFAIADLLGIRKLLGYAAVNARKFCSFCDLDHDNLGTVHQGIGQLRVGEDVRRAGRAYLDAPTIEKRKRLFKESGVRFSAVQQLSYRDPVRHTVLGMMHNWLEGILQHHVRVKWGFGGLAPKGTGTQTNRTISESFIAEGEENEGVETLTSSSGVGSESVDCMDVDVDNQDNQERTERYGILSNLPIFADIHVVDLQVIRKPSTENSFLVSGQGLQQSRYLPGWNVLQRISARKPTVNSRPICGGFCLRFSSPLILPELWHDAPDNRANLLLENFHLLVYCTNIVCSNIVTSDMPGLYAQQYHAYLLTSKDLFPHAEPRPNHHYAMHNTEQLRFWGPLPQVSEFFGERQNGQLQDIQTNGILRMFRCLD
jgi:hypothetical protein